MTEISPRLPNWLDQIQFIRFYLSNPCDVPFITYIETARPITGEIALLLLGFDFVQFTKNVLRPKWTRRYRHTRRGPSGKPKRGGIPEIADMLSDIVDPDQDLRPRSWRWELTMVVEAIDIVDRIYWTFFVIEMFQALIINSIIGVIEANKTKCPSIGRCLRSSDSFILLGLLGDDQPVGAYQLEYVYQMDSDTIFLIRAFQGEFVAVFCGTIIGIHDGVVVTPKLHIQAGADDHVEIGPTFTLEKDEARQFVLSHPFRGTGFSQPLADCNFGNAVIVDQRHFVIQVGN